MKIGPTKKTVIVREYHLDIGTVQVFDTHLVCNFNEGITLTLERAYQIIGITEIHYQNKNFGIISLRKNSYAIDPLIYTYLRELTNLKVMAVVSLKQMDMHNFKIERLFFKKPMKFFIDYNKAQTWVKRSVKRA